MKMAEAVAEDIQDGIQVVVSVLYQLASNVNKLDYAVKKELIPLMMLLATCLFVRVHYTRHYRRSWKKARSDGTDELSIKQVCIVVQLFYSRRGAVAASNAVM